MGLDGGHQTRNKYECTVVNKGDRLVQEVVLMLLRFDPFREVERELDRVASTFNRASSMPMDAWRQGDRFFVRIDVPGVDPSSIDLTVEKNVLTVTAERHWERTEGAQVVVAERQHGTYRRQLFLGEGLDTDRVEARYDHGVLTLSIPVAEAAKPKKVEIVTGETTSESKAIQAA